jgi:outer membrane protein insertion porin family
MKFFSRHLPPVGLAALLIFQSLAPSGALWLQPVAAQEAAQSEPVEKGTISGGENLTVDDVTVEGNRLVPTEDILHVVKTKRGDKFDREQVLQDLKAVNGMGYFDDRSLQVLPELANGGVLLKIRVQENAPVTQFAFHGNAAVSTEEISKAFADQLGKPQNLTQLSGSIEKVEQLYHDRGFVLARVTDVKDDPDGSISLNINEGVIEGIQITGNKKTKDFIIKRSIKLKPGSVYNERQLTGDLRKLYSNGYFQDIRRSLVPSPNDPDKYTLKVEVDEKRSGSVGLGGGVDTIAGPFGSFSFSDSNFRGRGQVLSLNSQIGTGMFNSLANNINNGGNQFLTNHRTYNIGATWVEPSLGGSNTSMAVSGFGNSFNSMMIDQAMQRSIGATVNFTRPVSEHVTAGLGFTGEQTMLSEAGTNSFGNFFGNQYNGQTVLGYLTNRAIAMGRAGDLGTAGAMAESIRNQQLKGGTYLSFTPSLTYDTRDKAMDPSKGTTARLTAGPSLGLAGPSFAKIGASVSKFVPLTKDTTLAMNMQGGQALGGAPQFSMYRLGGFNGIRGYRQFSDLGTGSAMLMASAEVRHKLPFPKLDPSNKLAGFVNPMLDNIKGVAFVDAGQVGGNSLVNSFFQRAGVGASVGLGLRVNVPMIGLIRLDYGFPLLSTMLGKMTPRFTVGFGDKF